MTTPTSKRKTRATRATKPRRVAKPAAPPAPPATPSEAPDGVFDAANYVTAVTTRYQMALAALTPLVQSLISDVVVTQQLLATANARIAELEGKTTSTRPQRKPAPKRA